MGTWGPGVFENDHALDLCSIEVRRLADELEKVLATPGAAFDDLEGPLLYVHLLAGIAKACDVDLARDRVQAWQAQYLEIFDRTLAGESPSYRAKRRKVITREFGALLARLPEPEPPKKKRAAPRRSR